MTSVDKTINGVLDMRSNFIDNIERQRLGFRNIGSPFYDRLSQELETQHLEIRSGLERLGSFRWRTI